MPSSPSLGTQGGEYCSSLSACSNWPREVCETIHSNRCVPALVCGNGVTEYRPLEGYQEVCDDGNQTNGDGCDANCKLELKAPGQPCDKIWQCKDGVCRDGICHAVSFEELYAPGPVKATDQFVFGRHTEISERHAFVSNFSLDICRYQDDPRCIATGAVEVFSLEGTKANYQARLVPPQDDASMQRFGRELAAHADTVAVSAVHESRAARTYIFRVQNSSWKLRQHLEAPESAPIVLRRSFGEELQLNERWLLVGQSWLPCLLATGANSGCPGDPHKMQGRVYVYERINDEWKAHSTLYAPIPAGGLGFGSALALHGDRVAISNSVSEICDASEVDSSTVSTLCKAQASVYLFEFNGSSWQVKTTISPPGLVHDHGFGSAIALSKDYLAVGAPLSNGCQAPKLSEAQQVNCASLSDSEKKGSGAVYFYQAQAGQWAHHTTLTSNYFVPKRNFGRMLDMGPSRLLVASNHEHGPCLVTGESVNNMQWARNGINGTRCKTSPVESFQLKASQWNFEAMLFHATRPGAGAESFGRSLALHGDRALVGAYRANHCPEGLPKDSSTIPGCIERGAASLFHF